MRPYVQHRLGAALLASLVVSLGACGTQPERPPEVEIVEVPVERFVEVPRSLTEPTDVPELPEGEVDTLSLIATYIMTKVRLLQCNGDKQAISYIGGASD